MILLNREPANYRVVGGHKELIWNHDRSMVQVLTDGQYWAVKLPPHSGRCATGKFHLREVDRVVTSASRSQPCHPTPSSKVSATGPAGLAVKPLDLHLVNVGSIPTGPAHGEV